MVITQQLRTALNTSPMMSMTKHLPMINSITGSYNNYLSEFGQLRTKAALIKWYKTIPELTAFVNKVAGDSVSRYHFEPVDPKNTNRNKLMAANRFSQEVVLSQAIDEQFVDALVTGEAFAWLGKITDSQLKDSIAKVIAKRGLETKEKNLLQEMLYTEMKAVDGFSNTQGLDEDVLKPRKYRAVPSSTTEIVFDQFDIKGYNHVVGLNTIAFTPKEIVHFTLMKRDGKPNGFSPVESILVQLELLRQMWINMLALHKNGGVPDYLFTLKNVSPGSPAYKRVEEQLMKYRLVENKHGNMLFTGDVSVEMLQQLDKMQFMESGLYITGLVAMQWGIPRSSIPFIVGQANTKDDTGGNSERGYWEVVQRLQTRFADTMNTQLWIPYFGVRIVFDNPYMNLDVQRETATMSKLQNVLSMDTILMKSGKQLSLDKRLSLIGLTEEDLEEAQVLEMEGTASGIGTSAQQSPSKVAKSDDKKNEDAKKKDEQTATIASQGKKPSGVGKEADISKIEYKEMDNEAIVQYKEEVIGVEPMSVSKDVFVKLYLEDKSREPRPPRVFVRQSDTTTTFIYRSVDFVYKTSIDNLELVNQGTFLMNISQALYRLN